MLDRKLSIVLPLFGPSNDRKMLIIPFGYLEGEIIKQSTKSLKHFKHQRIDENILLTN